MYSLTLANISLATVPLALPCLYYSSSSLISNFLSKRTTVVHELPDLGTPRPDGLRIKGTAVVCGGSFAGLWAARVLADHFEDVLVIEPEGWLITNEGLSESSESEDKTCSVPRTHARSRVFQYSACHALHPLSYHALKRFFPNLDEEVRKAGGKIGRTDFNIHLAGEKIKQNEHGVENNFSDTLYLSREAYERILRRLVVASSPRIRWMTGTASNVKLAEEDPSSISTVFVRLIDGSEKPISASLVVDCSGTTQAGLKWLKRVSSQLDKSNGTTMSSAIDSLRFSYATVQQTRTYRFFVPPEARSKLTIPGGYADATWLLTILPKLGKGTKSIYADVIEGHRVRMMFGTWGDQVLPDFDDIQSFIRSFDDDENVPVWLPRLVDELLEFRELAEFSSCKYPRLSWIRYENAEFLPRNFVAVGDSVMQANPTFGQGLAKVTANAVSLDAALRALELRRSDSLPANFSRAYFKDITMKTLVVWEGAKSIDYLWESTTPCAGDKLSDYTWLKSKLVLTILLLSRQDKHVGSNFWKTLSLTNSPTCLMSPSVLFKALAYYVTRGIQFS